MSRTTSQRCAVLFACDTFKGTLPSNKVGEAAEVGFRRFWASKTAKKKVPPTTACPQNTTGAAAASAVFPSADVASAMPFHFVHCPMSDGGAGLLDSIAHQHEQNQSPSAPEATTLNVGTAQPHQQSGASPSATPKHPSNSSSSTVLLQLKRVAVPASVPIFGPLGQPLQRGPTKGDSAASPPPRPSPSATGEDHPVYFACDVAHRVIVVEMAQAAGLPLLNFPSQRNPLETTSYGVGQILQYALRYMEEQVSASGATDEAGRTSKVGIRVLMGIGGSATNDGGLGALQALGLDLYVRPEEKVAPLRSGGHAVGDGTTTGGGVRLTRPFRGKDLERLTGAVVTPAMQQMFMHTSSTSLSGTPTSSKVFVEQFFLICDVDNPLVGPRGATYVFGPQKCAPVAKAATSAAPAAAREAARVGKPSTSQKASSSSSSSSASSKVEDVEEGAVGVVNSAEQQAVLDRLERGMQNAARAVVISTWPMLSSYRTPTGSLRGKPFACSAQSPCSDGAVEAQYQLLLHGPGGGGAGGMSGFFRYVLAASWLPGADAVAALLGLRLAPPFDSWLPALDTDAKGEAVTGRSTRVAQGAHAPPVSTSSCSAPLPTAASTPHGRLFTDCDVLVTGEGSFDSQTILSHKTVGRLLEMTVEANAWRMYAAIQSEASRPAAAATIVRTRHASLIREVLVVCGRCGFDSPEERQQAIESALCTTLLPTTTATSATSVARESTPDPMQTRREELQRWLRTIAKTANVSDVEALRCVTPKITVLPLTPDAFPVRQAMQSPYPCVVSVVERYLSEMDERGGGSGRSSSGAKGPAQRSRL